MVCACLNSIVGICWVFTDHRKYILFFIVSNSIAVLPKEAYMIYIHALIPRQP
jgi:hypothetical protein